MQNKSSTKIVTESSLRTILNKLLEWLPFKKTAESVLLVEIKGKPVFNIKKTGEVCIYNKNPDTGEDRPIDINKLPNESLSPDDLDNILK